MPKKKRFPAVIAVILVLLILAVGGYFGFRALQNSGILPGGDSGAQTDSSGNDSGSAAGGSDGQDGLVVGEDEQTMPNWVPYAIDNSPENPLDGFLYEGEAVEAASVRDAAASGDNEGRIAGQVKEKVPHYPFDQMPLLKPDMLVTSGEQTVDEDISVSVMYYTKATVDETLAFYRNKLGGYERFQEDVYDDASTGKSYSFSFAVTVAGGYEMDGSVMVMEMPETTGYTCAIMASGAIRGIAKKEVVTYGTREDGLPENFPDQIVTAYKVDEVYETEGDSEGCWVQFQSRATYQSAVKYYRDALSDKAEFSESNDVEGEVYFYCLAPGWEINVRIMDSGDGHAYVEINCYVQE